MQGARGVGTSSLRPAIFLCEQGGCFGQPEVGLGVFLGGDTRQRRHLRQCRRLGTSRNCAQPARKTGHGDVLAPTFSIPTYLSPHWVTQFRGRVRQLIALPLTPLVDYHSTAGVLLSPFTARGPSWRRK